MLGLKVCSDYTRYNTDERMIYLFHKENPCFDGILVFSSNPDRPGLAQVKLMGFNFLEIYRKTLLWGPQEINNSVTFNRHTSPEHEPMQITFRDKKGNYCGEILIKLMGFHHKIYFRDLDKYRIMRKKVYDNCENSKEIYGERLWAIASSYLDKEG